MCVEEVTDLHLTVWSEDTGIAAALDADDVRLRLETVAVDAAAGEADLLLGASGCVDLEPEGGIPAGPYGVRWALTCLLQLRSADLPPGTSAADACAAEEGGADDCSVQRPFYLGMTVSRDEHGWLQDSSCWWDPFAPWGRCPGDPASVHGAIDVTEGGFGASIRFGDGCFPEIDFEEDLWQLFSPVDDPSTCDWPDPDAEDSGCPEE